jgi:16S rRNA (guanine527-N7)-methyltransferase
MQGMPSPGEVASLAGDLGRELAAPQAAALAAYLTALVQWKDSVNLVSARDWRDALANLVADSWHLADFLAGLPLSEAPRCLDLGAGAGLPGLPLRVFWTPGRYLLVEPRRKRVAFMRTALGRMALARTEVRACRAEELPAAELPADLVLSRAFMPWRELLAFVRPMLAPGGLCVVMANQDAPAPAELPPGFCLAGRARYPSGAGWRYFWALSSASMSM